ncbi:MULTISPECIES: formate/nitrite transporter family protein [Pontibacillus]|uniref:Formate/nitrite transporter family protein n=1 Tax=Pontibacillus chungwhensis TaxID=265426 RepID=A0ABY8UYW0_9BACI|nr:MULTISPECIES: formate/nitrite transporter family protein [Pontibacillus]MCD5325410.1 formate/nitrite transporter family protein [Pontibacillus sp. HN14]WIF98525.1 formate/nitrite transporter family protein [Pontibacillus chungwhensis]
MEEKTIDLLIEKALGKKEMVEVSPSHYLIRAALAGIYIGFALILSFQLAQPFYEQHAPSTYLINALFFGIAFCLIIYGGSELFTSNTMYMTVSSLKKETTWVDTLKVWGYCYAGNVVGILFFTGMIYMTGLLQTILPDESLLIAAAEKKMNVPTSQLFFRAILANWLVCLAVWLPMQVKEDISKILLMMLLVFTFFISGYEHSIANIALFSLALSSPHTALVSMGGFIHNLIPVTLGNIIGGGFFVGAVYVYLNQKKQPAPMSIKALKPLKKRPSKTSHV